MSQCRHKATLLFRSLSKSMSSRSNVFPLNLLSFFFSFLFLIMYFLSRPPPPPHPVSLSHLFLHFLFCFSFFLRPICLCVSTSVSLPLSPTAISILQETVLIWLPQQLKEKFIQSMLFSRTLRLVPLFCLSSNRFSSTENCHGMRKWIEARKIWGHMNAFDELIQRVLTGCCLGIPMDSNQRDISTPCNRVPRFSARAPVTARPSRSRQKQNVEPGKLHRFTSNVGIAPLTDHYGWNGDYRPHGHALPTKCPPVSPWSVTHSRIFDEISLREERPHNKGGRSLVSVVTDMNCGCPIHPLAFTPCVWLVTANRADGWGGAIVRGWVRWGDSERMGEVGR